MLDAPAGPDLLRAVARLLRDVLLPRLQADDAFQARVPANAADLAAREWPQAPAAEAADRARLVALLGHGGDAAALEAELCGRIAEGRLSAPRAGQRPARPPWGSRKGAKPHFLESTDDPALLEHRWAGTLARLAIDQPAYAPYLDETGAAQPAKE